MRGDANVVVWGTGTPRREFLHVDDLADAVLYLLQIYDDERIVNIGWGEDVTIAHLAVGWGAGQLKVGSFARGERIGCVSGVVLPARLDNAVENLFEEIGGHTDTLRSFARLDGMDAEAVRSEMRSIFNGALGYRDMMRKDYAGAADRFTRASSITAAVPLPSSQTPGAGSSAFFSKSARVVGEPERVVSGRS